MENSNLQKNYLFSQMFLNYPNLCLPTNPYLPSLFPFQTPVTMTDMLQHYKQDSKFLPMNLLPQQLPFYANLLKDKLNLLKVEEAALGKIAPNTINEAFKSLQSISFTKHPSCQTEMSESTLISDFIKEEEKELQPIAKASTVPLDLKSVPVNNDLNGLKKKRRAGKKLWNQVEDALALELIAQHGTKWSKIGKIIGGRSGKQVRDRYLNNLRPDIKSDAWTAEEDNILISLYYKMGSKWSKIANFMPGRTESQVKNRFYTYIKMRLTPAETEKNTKSQSTNLLSSAETKSQETKSQSSYSPYKEEFIVKEENIVTDLRHEHPQFVDKFQQKKKVKVN